MNARHTWWMPALALVLIGAAGFLARGNGDETVAPDTFGSGIGWDHELHARHPEINCQACHHMEAQGVTEMRRCSECHAPSAMLRERVGFVRSRDPEAPDSERAPRMLNAAHAKCVGCHQAMKVDDAIECKSCHTDVSSTVECMSCHTNAGEVLPQHGHKQVACTSCHGPAAELVAERHASAIPVTVEPGHCMACHETTEGFLERKEAKLYAACRTKRGLPETWDAVAVDAEGVEIPAGLEQCSSCHAGHTNEKPVLFPETKPEPRCPRDPETELEKMIAAAPEAPPAE